MSKSVLSESKKELAYLLNKNEEIPQMKIAELFNVSQTTIHNAIKEQGYKKEIARYQQQQENAMAIGVATVAVQSRIPTEMLPETIVSCIE